MSKIPEPVGKILNSLQDAGFEAYVVGGCVRDLELGKAPKDWDITTNANPEQIQAVFPDSFYENAFLTVTVRTNDEPIPEVEITTYRTEAGYSDRRRPDQVSYAQTLEEDLSRRDFTVNAMALDGKGKTVDLFDGKKDLKGKLIRAVGIPEERFSEDALRMLRAVRLATQLQFSIEPATAKAITAHAHLVKHVSHERVRDELVKIIMSDDAAGGIELLRKLELLRFVLPELMENYGVKQNKHHIYDCYTHALKALEFSAKKQFSFDVRFASLLHDVGKPRTKGGSGANATFYNHEVVGARMAEQIMDRLKFPRKDIAQVSKLIRYHMFYYNAGEVTESSVRRLVRNVGPENMSDLLQLRQADRIGSGVPKAEPYKLRHLQYLIEKVSKDPLSVKMLKADGKSIMDALGIAPGPKIGYILSILLGYVLDDPSKNTVEFLNGEIKKLGTLDEKKLQALSLDSEIQLNALNTKEDEQTKKKFWVS